VSTPSRFRERLRARLDAAALSAGGDMPSLLASDGQLDQLEQYFDLLRHWNRKINLTALPLDELHDATIDRLLVEPLSAARLIGRTALRWADLGSGGGSPAIPLKIARPSAVLTMVESRQRKAAFLREVGRELGLGDVSVVGMRVEAMAVNAMERFDVVTVRAVRLDRAFLRTSAQLLRPTARLICFLPAAVNAPFPGFKPIEEIGFEMTKTRIVVLSKDFEDAASQR
jgi:16S rRNA (guanine527-N7)-methyltransferase